MKRNGKRHDHKCAECAHYANPKLPRVYCAVRDKLTDGKATACAYGKARTR